MSYQVSWDDDAQTIVQLEVTSPTTWAESFAAQEEANALIDAKQGETALILNFSRVKSMPPNFLSNVKILMARTHPRTEFVVLIGKNSFVQRLLVIAFRVYTGLAQRLEQKTIFALDVHDARTQIQERRVTRKRVAVYRGIHAEK